MSGRYVLVEFDDKDTAAKFKKQIDASTRAGKMFRVVGYFGRPDPPYCECGQEVEERTKPSSMKRLPKTGWLKCKECGLYSSMLNTRNLLGVEKIIGLRKFRRKHYKTRQPMDFVQHFLSISTVHLAAPKETNE